MMLCKEEEEKEEEKEGRKWGAELNVQGKGACERGLIIKG